MAPSQGAVKHDFVAKVAGGCSSYDVIALWPDLTGSIFFPKIAQGLPHKVAQNPAARSAAVFSLSAKNLRGRLHQPPLYGRGLNTTIRVRVTSNLWKEADMYRKFVYFVSTKIKLDIIVSTYLLSYLYCSQATRPLEQRCQVVMDLVLILPGPWKYSESK